MAQLRRRQAGVVAAALGSLLAFWTGLAAWAADTPATALLYERPVLTIDPGMHTAQIRSAAVDAAGQLRGPAAVAGAGQVAGTGSEDKTVRIWSVADGTLLHTIRMPAGPGDTGKIYAV